MVTAGGQSRGVDLQGDAADLAGQIGVYGKVVRIVGDAAPGHLGVDVAGRRVREAHVERDNRMGVFERGIAREQTRGQAEPRAEVPVETPSGRSDDRALRGGGARLRIRLIVAAARAGAAIGLGIAVVVADIHGKNPEHVDLDGGDVRVLGRDVSPLVLPPVRAVVGKRVDAVEPFVRRVVERAVVAVERQGPAGDVPDERRRVKAAEIALVVGDDADIRVGDRMAADERVESSLATEPEEEDAKIGAGSSG